MGIWPFYTKDDDKKPSAATEQKKDERTTQTESATSTDPTLQTVTPAETETVQQKPEPQQTVLVEGRPVVIDDQTTENQPQAPEAPHSVEREIPVTGDEPGSPKPEPKHETEPEPKQRKEWPHQQHQEQAQTQQQGQTQTQEQTQTQQQGQAQTQYRQGEQAELARALQMAMQNAMQSVVRHMDMKLDSIQRSNDDRQRLLNEQLEEKENIIKQQHNQLLKFQDDVIYKTQHGIIMELISIADNVRTILKSQQEKPDYDELLDDVQKLQGWIDSSLKESGVNKFEEAATLGFNPKRQTIVDSQPAPQPEQAGTYITEQPGYEWSIPYVVIRSDVQLQNFMAENKVPKAFSYVIRQEEVIKLK